MREADRKIGQDNAMRQKLQSKEHFEGVVVAVVRKVSTNPLETILPAVPPSAVLEYSSPNAESRPPPLLLASSPPFMSHVQCKPTPLFSSGVQTTGNH
mmetsp:Transcript_32550/g.82036  ORF Transcript_32550/g.82036 Transcript_32550/m.82036 type:complete len:98 (-) Transcript_32550:2395-2688(-)